MKRFEDKVVIVTGAASGLGEATAERLSQEGAKLVLVDLNKDALDTLADKLGGDVLVVKANVAELDDVGSGPIDFRIAA